ncbi:MAG: hypothetical protein P8L71_02095 [Flavobacteriales bacterium]|nr:hypothetical protein [Flavobacteriales bacterium]
MEYLAELLGWWLLAVVKFLALPWIMVLASDKGFVETVLVSTSGAAIGITVISFFGDKLFQYLSKRANRRGSKVFSNSRRRLVRIKNKFGLKGLLMIGGFLSVPITTLLATKYFTHEKHMVPKVIFGFFLWSIALTSLAVLFKNIMP